MLGKSLIITEKPSVARQFAAALGVIGNQDGYIEDDKWVITWCIGHLVSLSYPEAYDPALKKWSMDTLPFLPESYRYEVIKKTAKQYKIVKELLNRRDISVIYNAGDSGREGEYIQRLVYRMAGVEGRKGFGCVGYRDKEKPCSFTIWKSNALLATGHKSISAAMARKLLKGESITVSGLRSKAGKPYAAAFTLKDDGQNASLEMSFDQVKPRRSYRKSKTSK